MDELSLSVIDANVVRSGFNSDHHCVSSARSHPEPRSHIVKPGLPLFGPFLPLVDSRALLHYETRLRIVRLGAA